MKSRKGFTLIELLVVCALAVVPFIILCIIVACCISSCNSTEEGITAPKYDNGQVVQDILTKKQLLVAKNDFVWNKGKNSWDIKVKDGGILDKIGGFITNENEVEKVPED